MEPLQIRAEPRQTHFNFMILVSSKLKPTFSFSYLNLRAFLCCSSLALDQTHTLKPTLLTSGKSVKRRRVRVRAKVSETQLKENWLASLSYPLPDENWVLNRQHDLSQNSEGLEWVLGIDPDISGAVALLKSSDSGCSAQVHDSPHLKALVGKRIRRRLDAKSIVQLVRSFDAPVGCTAYIEQSIPFPRDGKQGWWSGGFGYGLWIGVLVSSGFNVVPVPSFTWKNEFELSGGTSTKDDSRRVASALFPSLSPLLKRKKDHGRAEALLIAAYGKGLKMLNSSCDSIIEKLET